MLVCLARSLRGGWGRGGSFNRSHGRGAPRGSTTQSQVGEKDEGEEGPQSILYGIWQTDEMQFQRAEGGIVPKDERGQVDCPPFASRLPEGTVHLPLRNLAAVCRRLGVDFAYAMVGFEVRSGRSVPKIEGVVVCEEYAEAVKTAHAEAVAAAEQTKRRKVKPEEEPPSAAPHILTGLGA